MDTSIWSEFGAFLCRGLDFQLAPKHWDVVIAGQNEIQVKIKFPCILTLIIHGSGIIRVRKRKLKIKQG